MPPHEDDALLRTVALSKNYHSVQALRAVDVTISRGAIHGLLGKNGAGKSTLVGLIAGSVSPTSGRIFYRGADITQTGHTMRQTTGIRLLEQHTEIVPHLSVTENLLMSELPRRKGGFVDWRAARSRATSILKTYGLDVPPEINAGELPAPEQKRLAITKTLAGNAELVLLDEPTTALTGAERRALFQWIRQLNERGQTFVFISHYSTEIRELCTEYTVIRDGTVAGAGRDPGKLAMSELSRLVVGADVREFKRKAREHRGAKLRLRDVTVHGGGPITLSVAPGEILGLVGLPGSGARELARALGGLDDAPRGEVTVDDRPVRLGNVRAARRGGIAYLTHDRIGEGLVGCLSALENSYLGQWPARRLVDWNSARRGYRTIADTLGIRASSPGQWVSELSGGNQQKVLISRLLEAKPAVLILDEPTAGVDVGVKEEIHRLIDSLTETGMAVLVLAYDTDELVRVVDRAVIFRGGAVAGELRGREVTTEGVAGALEDHS